MIDFPCAKINLGLNIVERRADGYHNLQTVFFPIPICDALEIKLMDPKFPSVANCDLKVTGENANCDETDERFNLDMGNAVMEAYAAKLGADCPFFITAEPAYAEGIGEILSPVKIYGDNLKGYKMVVVKPTVAVSTKEAFSRIKPHSPQYCCRDVVARPVEEWKTMLTNDFEESVFGLYPEVGAIKERLYKEGALYAQMSGSGSSVFGIFCPDAKISKEDAEKIFEGSRTYVMTV